MKQKHIQEQFKELVYIDWFDAVDDVICVASTVSFKESNAKIHIPKGWIHKITRFSINRIVRPRAQRKKQLSQRVPIEEQYVEY